MIKDLNSYINEFRDKCLFAQSEDDIKAAGNLFFYNVSNVYGIKIDSHSEHTYINGGRADSVYNNIIFEYKDLGVFDKKKGVEEAVYGRDEKDHGICHYLINSSLDECHRDKDVFESLILGKVGVGFDGKHFVICRFKRCSAKINIANIAKSKHYPTQFPHEFNIEFEQSNLLGFDMGVKRLLLLIRSTRRNPLTSTMLCNSFSSNSTITKNTISYLYSLLSESLHTNTRISTLYHEWERIFGTIYDEDNTTDFVKYEDAIRKTYKFNGLDVNVKQALFTLQTFYSIIIKLLIQNLFESLVFPNYKTLSLQGRSDLVSLFHGQKGSKFSNYIDNFFEVHFFEWFTLAESFDVKYINEILIELDKFETTVSVIKPEIIEDVLKKTYESIMPKELRHLMGEYYTVNWLADFTIEKSGYDLGVNTSVLDPTCGSGTFITHLIKCYKNKYDGTLDYNSLVHHIINNFVGFDINPIAVIQAKGNYILSLGDITAIEERVSIPVYMCDSILVPTVYAKQKDDSNHINIKTSVGYFKLPLFENRQTSDTYLKLLSECILNDYTEYELFKARLKKQHNIELDSTFDRMSRELFDNLLTLHLSGKDGFWPIILKNSFAPLFCKQKFDYIIGNPPWIAWKAMSESYRNLTLDIWLSYGIFEKSAYDKITSHDDFAMAVTYVAIDQYLKPNGIAALILPQTFVKSLKGGEGFRKFCITRDGLKIPFALSSVYDMLKVNPFKGVAANKTSIYIFEKNKDMNYPMDNYFEMRIKKGCTIVPDEHYNTVCDKLEYEHKAAKPITAGDIRSPWLTLSPDIMKHLDKYLKGKSREQNYRGRKGIEPCGAKGIYLINVTGKKKDLLQIENYVERSRLAAVIEKGVHTDFVEKDLVYPMVGGRNIDKWGLNSHIYMIVPHKWEGDGIYRGLDESIMQSEYFHAYDWLYYFHDVLLETRIRSAKFYDPDQFPWYRLDNVGEYTFSKYKVLWKEQSQALTCCVVSSMTNEFVDNKTVVTDSKVLGVSLDNEQEAYYLCGILNSSEIEDIIQGYTISTNRGVDIVKNIYLPKFDERNTIHKKIAAASMFAHQAYLKKDFKVILEQENIINTLVPLLYQNSDDIHDTVLHSDNHYSIAEDEIAMAAEGFCHYGSVSVILPKTSGEQIVSNNLNLVLMYAIGPKVRKHTQESAKIALGIKENKLTTELQAAYLKVKYVMFHYWKNESASAFELTAPVRIVSETEIPKGFLRRQEKEAQKYLLLEYNPKVPINLGETDILKVQIPPKSVARYLPFIVKVEDIKLN